MSKRIEVRIKATSPNTMYLDGVDAFLGVAIPYMGNNPPTFGKREATKIVNWLNELESQDGYVKHDWKIQKA